MKVILEQKEIEDAIKRHIGPTGWGIPLDSKKVTIEIRAHRGENGFSAEVELTDVPREADAEADPDEDAQAIPFDFKD